MALSDDDLAAIAKLLDAKLDQRQADERRRRRWWNAFWLFLLLGSSLLAAIILHRWIEQAKDALDQQHQAAEQAAAAYRAELARNQAWQAERQRAATALGYRSGQSQPAHEAALMHRAITLMGRQAELRKKWEGMDFDDPRSAEILAQDLGEVLEQGLGTVGAVLLRGTDPAHAPPVDPRHADGLNHDAPPLLEATPKTP